jgi:hypothetical protein
MSVPPGHINTDPKQLQIADPKQPQQKGTDEDLAYYESRRGQGWEDPNNMKILTEWIHYAAVYLDILSEATEGYKKTLRMNTIINLIVSTLASTISVSTFNTNEENSPKTALTLKIIFTILTFTLTIAAGYIKVYQIQEKLENSLRLKQEWALFGSKISSEMQLPLILRKNAIFLISTMKGTYLDLVKSDMGIKKDIIRRMAVRSGLAEGDLTLSELFERIIKNEIYRIQDYVDDASEKSPTMEKHLTAMAESYGLQTPQVRRMSRSTHELRFDIDKALASLPPDATSIPMPAALPDREEQRARVERAAKEAEMIKKAFGKQTLSNDIVQGVKGFINKITPSSSSAEQQREDNTKQLLSDRGRVSSFLRAPRKAVPRSSIVTLQRQPSATQLQMIPVAPTKKTESCPHCDEILSEGMCKNCDAHYPSSAGSATGSAVDDHDDEMSSVISSASATENP